jgi:dTMP kinase
VPLVAPATASATAPATAAAAAPGAHGEPGLLVVLEGIDRSGRSTHSRLLEQHLRYRGRGVIRTSLGTGSLAGPAIRRARSGRTHDASAIALLDAADLAERIEQVVQPSLRAGLVVLADRYAYTPMARARTRGVEQAWLDAVFSFVTPPDAVLWLEVDPATTIGRRDRDPDAYEAGLDLGLAADVRESYRVFQSRLAATFEGYAERYAFSTFDAVGRVDVVEGRLEAAVDRLIDLRRVGSP